MNEVIYVVLGILIGLFLSLYCIQKGINLVYDIKKDRPLEKRMPPMDENYMADATELEEMDLEI